MNQLGIFLLILKRNFYNQLSCIRLPAEYCYTVENIFVLWSAKVVQGLKSMGLFRQRCYQSIRSHKYLPSIWGQSGPVCDENIQLLLSGNDYKKRHTQLKNIVVIFCCT